MVHYENMDSTIQQAGGWLLYMLTLRKRAYALMRLIRSGLGKVKIEVVEIVRWALLPVFSRNILTAGVPILP